MNEENKIIVEGVTKQYKMYNTPTDKLLEALSLSGKVRHTNFCALSNISFSVNKGEILGIMGRNGAGKSTLLKIITGVLNPTQGRVVVNGKVSSLLELGAGFNPEYTGIENIFFYGTMMKLSKKQIDEKLSDILEFAEIGDYVYQPVKTYSSGMFARLAFSCAINVEPDILIVDEILSVGDIRFQSKCFNKFKEFRDKGVTILYVGHDVSLMKTFCDKALWLNNGSVVEYGEPTYVSAKYVEFMYLDDLSEFTPYKKISKTQSDNNNKISISENIVNTNDEDKKKSNKKISNNKFSQAIAHWGTNIGLINYVNITDIEGNYLTHFTPNEEIYINIRFENNIKIDLRYLSVAFSIKNKEGTDLIVKTTYDEDIIFKQTNKKEYSVSFKLQTHLAMGEYYLVVALENRKEATTMYYEYIEGAVFFKIYSNKKIYGIVDLNTEIIIG